MKLLCPVLIAVLPAVPLPNLLAADDINRI